ncbi:DUF5366 family protein [Cytobacillus firmus]|uniref:DUF5366 family protein n=1 Tax=Cytobacillus firmus TaxID=1399 RepID=UPI00157FFF3D|nr:DUF5366 family protein [Cytobacillus firmus]NUH83584.1 YufK family protein [Cytobacillus firmus]
MKNTYLTSYFPLLAIIMFSTSLALKTQMELVYFLKKTGIYQGMLEFFSESGVKLSLTILLLVLFFMVFAALKLVADTINGLSLLFFSKDLQGESLTKARQGSAIYFIGGALSLLSLYSYIGIVILFAAATITYFCYFVYKTSSTMTVAGLAGVIFFQVIVWSSLLSGVLYLSLKIYNSMIASLPI